MKFVFILITLFATPVFANPTLCLAGKGGSTKLDRYDFEALTKKGVDVVLRTDTTRLDRYDIVAISGASKGTITVCVMDRKFDRYDLEAMARAGVNLVLFTSAGGLDRFDVVSLIKKGRIITLVVNDDSWDRYDLETLLSIDSESLKVVILQ